MNKPSLIKALSLKCPYCGNVSLLAEGNPFTYAEKCTECFYKFERDESYYSGSNQLISFPVAGTAGLLLAGLLYAYSGFSVNIIVGISFFTMVIFIFLFWPFSMALWLWMDHTFKPLTKEECSLVDEVTNKD